MQTKILSFFEKGLPRRRLRLPAKTCPP